MYGAPLAQSIIFADVSGSPEQLKAVLDFGGQPYEVGYP